MIRVPSSVIEFRDWHAYEVCMEMRPDEIVQYMALTGATHYDFEVCARGFINTPGVKFTLADTDDKGRHSPFCIGGFQEVMPGVWQSWMGGTDTGWQRHWREITKASLWLQQELFASGARRLQTNALASRTAATEWYEKALHLKYEGTWAEFGSNGEDVACYAITRRDYGLVRE